MKVLTSIAISLFLISCAHFKIPDIERNNIKSQSNLSLFNGTYELAADNNLMHSKNLLHLNEEIANGNLHYALTEELDSLSEKTILVDVKSFNDDYLSFSFHQNQEEKDFVIIRGKLKEDGFFYSAETRFDCIGFPFLFGGCYNWKMRLAVSQDKGLIINKAVSNKGALLLFLLSWDSYNVANHFKRVRD